MEYGLTKDITVPLRPGKDRLQTYFDTVEITSNKNRYEFFPPNSNQDGVRQNYSTNPLPENKDRVLLAFGLHVTHPILTDDVGDPVAVANGLSFGTVLFTLGQDESKVLEETTQRYLRAKTPSFQGTGSSPDSPYVVMEDSGLVLLNQQFGLKNNTKFGLQVTFDDASNFPSADNGLHLQATVQVAEGPDIIDRVKASMN